MRSFHRIVAGAALAALGIAVALAATAKTGSMSGDELAKRMAAGAAPVVLDVRSPEEFAEGHIPGAVNIPYDELAKRISEVPAKPDEEVVVHCQSGRRAAKAEQVLEKAGYTRVYDLEGHMAGWKDAGRPLE